ncbi:hypothetical protein [Streptomyces chartreusis]
MAGGRRYDVVVLTGHSLGGLLALGMAGGSAQNRDSRRAWAEKVSSPATIRPE